MGSIAWGNALQAAGQGLTNWAQFRDQQQNRDEALRQRDNELGLRQMEIDRQAMLEALKEERATDAQNLSQATSMASMFGGQPVGGNPMVRDMLDRNPYMSLVTDREDPMQALGALGVMPSQREGAAEEQLTWRMPESEKLRIAQGNWANRLGVANINAEGRARVAEANARAAMDRLNITDATKRAQIDAFLKTSAARIAQARDAAELNALEDEFATQVRYIIGAARASDPRPNGLAALVQGLTQGQGGGAQGGAPAPGGAPVANPPPAAPPPVAPMPPPPSSTRGMKTRDPKNPQGLTPPPGR